MELTISVRVATDRNLFLSPNHKVPEISIPGGSGMTPLERVGMLRKHFSRKDYPHLWTFCFKMVDFRSPIKYPFNGCCMWLSSKALSLPHTLWNCIPLDSDCNSSFRMLSLCLSSHQRLAIRIQGTLAFGGKMDASYLRSANCDQFEIPAAPSLSYSPIPTPDASSFVLW